MKTKRRSKRMTDKRIIALFKYHNPSNLTEILKLKIVTTYFDKGCDRRVYRLGRNLIMKMEDARTSSFDQTPTELAAFRRINTVKKLKPLRKHIPKIYYASLKNRITITPFYPGGFCDEDEDRSVDEKTDYLAVVDLFEKLMPDYADDLHNGNFRRAKDGTIICVDLGYTGDASW